MNPYKILGLEKDCTSKQIKNAFRNLSKTHHPDVGGDPEVFIQINIAVQLLRDPYKRDLYDRFGIFLDISEENLNVMVHTKFKELVVSWIDRQIQTGSSIPINRFMIDIISQHMSESIRSADKLKEVIINLGIRKNQVSVSSGENLVQKIIDERITDIRSNIERMEQDRCVMNLLMDMCNKYSSKEMEQMVSTHTVQYFSFVNMNTA